jgi:hypothetical protein
MPMGGLLPYPGDVIVPSEENISALERQAQDQAMADSGIVPGSAQRMQADQAQADMGIAPGGDSYRQRMIEAAKLAVNRNNPEQAAKAVQVMEKASGPVDPNQVTDAKGLGAIPADHEGDYDTNQKSTGQSKGYNQYLQYAAGLGMAKDNRQVFGPGHAFAPIGGREMVQKVYDTGEQAHEAAGKLAAINKEEQKQLESHYRRYSNEMAAQQAQHEVERINANNEIKARIASLHQEADNISKTRLDQGRLFKNPAGALGAIAAVFMPLFSHDPMAGVNLIQQNVQRDLDIQMAELQTKQGAYKFKANLLGEMMALTNNEQQARQLAEIKLLQGAQFKLNEMGARFKSERVDAQLQAQNAEIDQRINDRVMQINVTAWREAQMEDPRLVKAYGKDFFGKPATHDTGKDLMSQADGMIDGFNAGLNTPTAVDLARAGTPTPETVAVAKSPQGQKAATYAKAIGKVVLKSDPAVKEAVKQFKYDHPGLESVIDQDAKDTMAGYLVQYHGDVRKATEQYAKDLREAMTSPDKGVPAIEKAAAEYGASAHLAAETDQKLQLFEQRLGGPAKADKFLAKIGMYAGAVGGDWGASVAQNWENIKGDMGFRDEDRQEAINLARQLGLMKATNAKVLFGSVNKSDASNLGEIMDKNMTWNDWRFVTKEFSRLSQVGVNGAIGRGTPMAQNIYRAGQIKRVSAAQPSPGVRAPKDK